jgi:hypothetical protein
MTSGRLRGKSERQAALKGEANMSTRVEAPYPAPLETRVRSMTMQDVRNCLRAKRSDTVENAEDMYLLLLAYPDERCRFKRGEPLSRIVTFEEPQKVSALRDLHNRVVDRSKGLTYALAVGVASEITMARMSLSVALANFRDAVINL